MQFSLFFRTDAIVLCLILFFACILMVRVARFVRNRFFYEDKEESRGGVNSLLGALFGLWGFMLAFTFGSTSSRFDLISNTMVEESNAIRNVVYRSRLFPDSVGSDFRATMRKYLESRIDYYQQASDPEKFNRSIEDTKNLSRVLWEKTQYISTLPEMGFNAANMYSALSTMYDLAAKRDAMLLKGMPELIYYLLFFLALVISFTGGFTTPKIATKEWVIIVGFVSLACIIIYITLDLNRPMRGLIRPDVAEYKLEQLRGSLTN